MSELYLPDIRLQFDKFCEGCTRYDLDIIKGDQVYIGEKPEKIYIFPTAVVCKHMDACKRVQRYMEEKNETNQSN